MGSWGKCTSKLQVIALAVAALSPFLFAPEEPALADFQITCPSSKKFKIDAQQSPGYEQTIKDGVKEKFSSAQVKCTSCFRSEAEQRAACRNICGADSCPNLCAPPGRSNHQKVATCDIQKIPGDAKKGCEFLFEMCQTMRAQQPSLGCEIGGYGPGAHHLAVGPGIRNSAYNQCKFLKSKMGSDPSAFAKQEKKGDDLYNQVMSPQTPPADNSAQPQQAAAQLPGFSMPAAYPTSNGSFRLPPTQRQGPTPITSYRMPSSGPKDPRLDPRNKDFDIGPPHARESSDVTKDDTRPGQGAYTPTSGISGGGNDGVPSGVTGGAGGPIGNAQYPGGAPGGGSAGALGQGGSFGEGTAPAGVRKNGSPAAGTRGATNEALASYGGGGAGGPIGNSKLAMSSKESAAAVDKFKNDFVGVNNNGGEEVAEGEAQPAYEGEVQAGSEIGAREGASLFERAHAAHERSIQKGKIRF